MSSTVGHGPEPLDQVKGLEQFEHVEQSEDSPNGNLEYEEDDEPEFHAKTYFALAFWGLRRVYGNHLTLKYYCDTNLPSKAVLYRERSQQYSHRSMGAECISTGSSRARPLDFLRIGYFPSPQSPPCWPSYYIIHWLCNCTWVNQYISSDCSSSPDRFRICYGTPGILYSQ